MSAEFEWRSNKGGEEHHDQMQTNLDVADNSGAASGHVQSRCSVLQEALRHIGDVIVVSVKEAIPRGRVKKGEVMKGRRGGASARISSAPMARSSASTATRRANQPADGAGGTRIFGRSRASAAKNT